MKRISSKSFLLVAAGSLSLWSCQKSIDKPPVNSNEITTTLNTPKDLKDFDQVNLVGDNGDFNPARIDATLVNAWGVAFSPLETVWVSSMVPGLSEVYRADGTDALPKVTIPSPADVTGGGHPTGVVFYGGAGFTLPNNSPAKFIFAGADGVISGWNGGTAAVRKVNDAGELYAGIAIASDGQDEFLYVANFLGGKIDVFDTSWTEVDKPFVDPNLPAGYGPFNIQNVDGKLYVMYAKIGANPAQGQVVSASPGNGFVDVFNPDGSFVKRFISQGQLNAPWGITKAPAGFWGDGSDVQNIILVGNFGDGHINAYNSDGVFQGQLRSHGNPIEIQGLWGIAFAPANSTTFDHDRLFFAAGPGGEKHGLFGFIKK
jgi:uncharacterized protein (TIGR03118 family)